MEKNGTIISYSILREIPAYWLFENGKYTYCERYNLKAATLPTIGIEYESILKEHGILYLQISDTELELWDENCYEEVDVTLPTFIRWEGGYRRVKDHTGAVITKETQDASIALNANVVLPAIEELMRQKEMEKRELALKQFKENLVNMLLDAMGKSNVAVIETFCSFYDIGDEIVWSQNGRNLKIYRVSTKLKYFPYWIAFDMDKMPSSGYLELQVPKGEAGMFIGREGWQVKMWAKALGLKYIYVTEKEE